MVERCVGWGLSTHVPIDRGSATADAVAIERSIVKKRPCKIVEISFCMEEARQMASLRLPNYMRGKIVR